MNDDQLIRLHSTGQILSMKWDPLFMTRDQHIEVLRGEFDLVDDPAERAEWANG